MRQYQNKTRPDDPVNQNLKVFFNISAWHLHDCALRQGVEQADVRLVRKLQVCPAISPQSTRYAE